MDKINNLLKLTSSYCERATWSYLSNRAEINSLIKEAAAGDKYDEIDLLSRQLDDRALGSELELLAKQYQKVLEMGGGYNTIKRSIDSIANMFLDDEDDPQQEMVSDLLNDVMKDLRARAGGPGGLAKPDSPQAVAALKEVKDQYNSESLAEDFEDLQQFDPTAGLGGGGEGGAAPNRGITFRSRKTPKEWAEFFESEKENYQDTLLTETKKPIRDKISKLIEVLDKLSTATTTELGLLAKTSVLKDPDPALNSQLMKVREELKALKKERRSLKVSIRDYELSNEQKRLEEELKNATNPRDKIRLKHEVELYKTLQSKDIGKTKERDWRRVLLKSMSGGNWPGEATLQNMEKEIEKYSKPPYRKPITEVYVEKANVLRDKKEKGDFSGLVIKLKQHVPNVKRGEKKVLLEREAARLISAASAAEQTTYKPYLDAIAAAHASGDKKAIHAAIVELEKALNSVVEQFNEIKKLVTEYEIVTNYRKDLEVIDGTGVMKRENVTPDEIAILSSLLQEGNKVMTAPGIRTSTRELVGSIMVTLDQHIQAVGKQVRVAPEEEPMEEEVAEEPVNLSKMLRGSMNKQQRKDALKAIEKQALLKTESPVAQILNDPALNSTQDSQEYAHKVFQALLANMQDKLNTD